MAQRFHVSSSTIYRLWRAHNLQPHRVANFKFSTDPDFVPKLRDIVGWEPTTAARKRGATRAAATRKAKRKLC
jgi:hypothetical protein